MVDLGFKRSSYLEPLPPTPSSEGFKLVIDAVREATDGDMALALIGKVLIQHGFHEEGWKCFRFPPVFDVPRETPR